MLNQTLIYLVPLLPCLLPSPPLFVSGIPLTHHSSSHLPPLPPASPYRSSSALTFLSFQHISLCVFLSLHVCSYPPPTLTSSPAELCLSLGSVAVMILTNSLDTVLALVLICLFFFFSFTVLSLPPSVTAFRHKNFQCEFRQTQRPLEENTHTHTQCLH